MLCALGKTEGCWFDTTPIDGSMASSTYVVWLLPWPALQESLSLSHAVTVVLSQLYQARLSALAGDPLAADYRVMQAHELAEGYSSSGTE